MLFTLLLVPPDFQTFPHPTLIRGAVIIQQGLKSQLIITIYYIHCILTKFQLCVQSSHIADFSPLHSGEFCPLLQISTFACLFPCYH